MRLPVQEALTIKAKRHWRHWRTSCQWQPSPSIPQSPKRLRPEDRGILARVAKPLIKQGEAFENMLALRKRRLTEFFGIAQALR